MSDVQKVGRSDWPNFIGMLKDIHAYRQQTGSKIELFDDPFRLLLGYKAGDRFWQIRLSTVSRTFNIGIRDEPQADLVRELIKTADGRYKLANEVTL